MLDGVCGSSIGRQSRSHRSRSSCSRPGSDYWAVGNRVWSSLRSGFSHGCRNSGRSGFLFRSGVGSNPVFSVPFTRLLVRLRTGVVSRCVVIRGGGSVVSVASVTSVGSLISVRSVLSVASIIPIRRPVSHRSLCAVVLFSVVPIVLVVPTTAVLVVIPRR